MRSRLPVLALLALVLVATAGCRAPVSGKLPVAQIIPASDNPAGRILFVKGGNLWLWSGGSARQLTTGDTWRQPSWSPDGSEIAYVYQSTNFSEIFVMSADGSNNRRLTRSQSSSLPDNDWVFRPTWSPDGQLIAYVSDSSSYNPTVWLMNRDGSGKRPLSAIAATQEAADGLSWSPDGKQLAVASFGRDTSQIVAVDLARGVVRQLTATPRGALDPAWSPDGQLLAYAARESDHMEIRIRRLDGGQETTVARDGFSRAPTWSPDGRQLAFISSKGGSFEVYVVDVAVDASGVTARNERQLTRDLNIDAVSGLSWAK